MSSKMREYDEVKYIPLHVPTKHRIPRSVAPDETFIEFLLDDFGDSRVLTWLRQALLGLAQRDEVKR